MSQREKIIAKLDQIPAMPVIVTKLTQMLSDPNVSFREIAEVVKYDPGITSNVLRLANSAYFGFASTVDSVQQGIVRLGTRRMYELVLAAAVGPMAQQAVKGYDLPPGSLWKHSITVAIGTEQIAEILKIKLPDFAFTAGLLHDIGKIILGTFVEVDVAPIINLVNNHGLAFNEAERKILGINHSEIGALLFKKWNIPQPIIDVIRWHHNPVNLDGDQTIVNLVHIADIIAIMSGIGSGQDGLSYRSSESVFNTLKLNPSQLEACACQTMTKVEELENIFSFPK